MFWDVQPHYIGNLKRFGETGTVKTLIKGNMVTNRGFTGMFVGYPENHAAGTFLMLNLKTKKVVTTRTVDWNNESYGTTMKLAKENICNLPFENEDIESDEDGDFIHDILDVGGTETELENANNQATTLEENNDGEITETKLNRVHELRNLECFDNPTPGAYKDSGRLLRSGMIQEKLSTMTEIQDSERRELCFLTNELEETYTPMKYAEAWDHPDTKERERWRAAIKKEMEDAIKRGVYKKCKRKDVPSNKRCVKCKWVFKRKTSGIYRARLVACGYSQIVNVDFTESFSPVINDLCWKILIILKIVMNLSIRLLDVETAFQQGDLDHQIFMEPPPGLEHFMDINPEEDCVELGQCTYGLVQASRQYRKKFVATVKKHGVYETKVDPCLMTKVNAKTGKSEIYMGTHVDDSLTVGKLEDIKKLQEHMNKEGLTTKCEEVDEYLGCKVAFSKDGKKAWLGQPETIKKLEREFGEDVKKLKSYTVPGTPGIGVLRPSSKEDVLGPEEQSRYRSGVGMLLWINKTRPDLSNAVRELSKVADGATKEAMKEMMRVIKYTIDTKNVGLKIEPKIPQDAKDFKWELEMFSDSDWAGDKDNRKSVSGFILFLLGVPISHKSRQQQTVSLSTAEAEWIALSEAIKEILFAIQVLESLGITVMKPVVVRVDNMGAIFMAKNTTMTKRTKHIDVKACFVHEHVDEDTGEMKIVFVRSGDNKSDPMTKNTPRAITEKHLGPYQGEASDIDK